MVIVKSGMCWCTLPADEVFGFLDTLSPCLYLKKQNQRGIYLCSTIGNNRDPLSSWWIKITNWWNNHQGFLESLSGKMGLGVPHQW